jgi:hypothetical protein
MLHLLRRWLWKLGRKRWKRLPLHPQVIKQSWVVWCLSVGFRAQHCSLDTR